MEYINKVIDFLNENPIMSAIIIIVLLIVVHKLYNHSKSENFESNCIVNHDAEFHSEYTGPTRITNFKCLIDDKPFYLANIPKADCEGSAIEKDCYQNVLILMNAEDIDNNIKLYMEEIEKHKQVCNLKEKLDCETKHEKKCDKHNEICDIKRKYIHDFTITEIPQSIDKPSQRKYVFKGIAKPFIPGTPERITSISNNIYETHNVNIACGDVGSPETSQLLVIEQYIDNQGGIIGGLDSPIRVKLCFESQVTINGVKVFDGTVPRMKKLYLGLCRDKRCKYNNKEFLRVCLYEDAFDHNVLSFEPKLVH